MQYFVDLVIIGLTVGVLYGLIALGISFIYSGLDMVHFAHGEIFMFGAFIANSAIQAGMPYPVAFIVAALGAAVLGVIVERLFYRRLTEGGGGLTVAGMGLIICGFGISTALQNLAYLIWGPAPRGLHVDFGPAISVGAMSLPRTYIVIIIVSIVLVTLLHFFLKHTRLGLAVRGVAHSKSSSYLMGVNVPLAISLIFGVACVLAGAAGVLAAPITYIHVQMGAVVLLKAFAAAVVGGLGNLPGAIVGGLIVGVTESLGAGFLAGEYKDVYSFLVLITVLMIKPSGLFGTTVQEKA
jgi:branched-chain amino acid transport system permease protein